MIDNLIKISHISNSKLLKLNEKILADKMKFYNYINTVKSQKISLEQLYVEKNFIQKNNINLIDYHHDYYPKNFINIINPPLIFYGAGDLSLLKKPKVAIVGSRVANLNNIYLAQQLSDFLVQHGVVVVSGFARGVDTVAHQAAHNNTIAVLGTGLNKLYPRENKLLFEYMKKQALVVSEYPVNTLPLKYNFPRRNRLIAALADITIIIEAKYNSGSSITAKYALEYNKEIFAVPGHPFDSKVAGCNKLIKDGAHMLTDFDEILEILARQYSTMKLVVQKPIIEDKNIEQNLENKNFNQKIINLLSEVALFPEQIAGHLNVDSANLNIYLSQLELENKIYQDGSGRIARKFVN